MKLRLAVSSLLLFLVSGCASSTSHIPAVSGFDAEKYLGSWYEIARLPNGFEKGLKRVRAEYTLGQDRESIAVLNRGFDAASQQWREARGTAVFRSGRDIGLLDVTFFRPFWGEYKIIVLDPDYRYAMVTSSRMTYLWILSRTPKLEDRLLNELIGKAGQWGFKIDELIIVEQP